MDQSLNVGALVVRGSLRWNEATTAGQTIYLCAGYVAVEGNGFFLMNIQQLEQTAWLYINHNGAEHPKLRTRAFGGVADSTLGGNATIDIQGQKLTRTWTLLSSPLLKDQKTMRLMHNPTLNPPPPDLFSSPAWGNFHL